MKDRLINKVKVIREFPGFDEGDILIFNTENGLFEFSYNEVAKDNIKDTAVINIFNAIAKHKPILSKLDISRHMGYFEDISEYEMKDREWVLERIEELKVYIRELDKDVEDDVVSVDVNVNESRAVWQNIIWEYETLLGMRKLIA